VAARALMTMQAVAPSMDKVSCIGGRHYMILQ